MLIGITPSSYREKEFVLKRDYTQWLELNRLRWKVVFNSSDLDGVDGVILTGGQDINPATYGEQNTDSVNCDISRDMNELNIISYCSKFEIPLLGICRGFQLLSVWLSENKSAPLKMLQDIDGHVQDDFYIPDNGIHHSVSVVGKENNWLYPLGLSYLPGFMYVNSRHHQAVVLSGDPKDNLEIKAIAKNGKKVIVEALRYKNLAGVQWHPENFTGNCKLAEVFQWLKSS